MTISVQSLQDMSKGIPQMLPGLLRPSGHPTCPFLLLVSTKPLKKIEIQSQIL